MKDKNRASLISIAILSLSLLLISCGDGGSSNGSSRDNNRVDCTDNFGDESRCNAREQL